MSSSETVRRIASPELDPITTEVVGNALASIADEMGETLVRAAYSTNIKERRDCSTALFDAAGRLIVQAEHIPIHLGSLIGVVEEVLQRFPQDEIRSGDVFIGNDAYAGGGTHLPDIVIAAPIFSGGRIVAWSANVAHHADFVDRGHDHIYQEGLRIPPIRLYQGGTVESGVLALILQNCQVPSERRVDLLAQIAANDVAVRRFGELSEHYGLGVLLQTFDALLDYGERRMRAGIAEIPDGKYHFTDVFDSEELDQELELGVDISVDGDEITLDFRRNPPQVRAGLNMVYTALLATVYYVMKAVTDPDTPANAGSHRPIRVLADEGTILSAREPAAVNNRTSTCQRVADVVLGALAAAMPDRVPAAGNGANTAIYFSGVDPRNGSYYVYLETLGGGAGASRGADGTDGVQVHITNTSNLPVEALEREYPLVVECYEFAVDSGGRGEWRGGCGLHRRIRVVGHECALYVSSTRRRSAPWGLLGGGAAAPASWFVHGRDAREFPRGAGTLHDGEELSITTAGGGGYGDPRRRSPSHLRDDVADGKVSANVSEKQH